MCFDYPAHWCQFVSCRHRVYLDAEQRQCPDKQGTSEWCDPLQTVIRDAAPGYCPNCRRIQDKKRDKRDKPTLKKNNSDGDQNRNPRPLRTWD